MKIRIALTIDVDPQDWIDSGLGGGVAGTDGKFTAAAVREDIRSYLLNIVQCSPVTDEANATVTLA